MKHVYKERQEQQEEEKKSGPVINLGQDKHGYENGKANFEYKSSDNKPGKMGKVMDAPVVISGENYYLP